MKKTLVLLIYYFFVFNAGSQTICIPSQSNTAALDEPPGCHLCVSSYSGNTVGFTPDTTVLSGGCGTIEGNQWVTIKAESSGVLNADLRLKNCAAGSGAKIAIFNQKLKQVSSCKSRIGNSSISTVVYGDTLTPLKDYHVMIDKIGSGNCEYTILVRQHLYEALPILDFNPAPTFFCRDDVVRFSIQPLSFPATYKWVMSDNAEIVEGGELQDTFVSVRFTDFGTGWIRVNPYSGCRGSISTLNRFKVVTDKTGTAEAIICSGEKYFISNEIFTEAGIYNVQIPDSFLTVCDSTIILDLKIADTSAISIECFQDTFLNTITINWEKRILADQYQIYIKDSLVSTQSFNGYLYQPQFPSEEINIKIQPIGSHGCEYAPGYLTCTAPDLTNSREFFEKEVVSVFPNPSSGIFEVFSEERIERIEVFDLSGKKVKTVFNTEIDLSIFESSIYFLNIYYKNQVTLKKIIKL